ncbi:hypothetical protein AB0A05_27040 [Streptomyces sp. NPDC046374]|uniref:hypothetical protein n=1 Tax=Streptomyces sp. NPDC046374 TaxID=3154917 RepID=UPI00340063DB
MTDEELRAAAVERIAAGFDVPKELVAFGESVDCGPLPIADGPTRASIRIDRTNLGLLLGETAEAVEFRRQLFTGDWNDAGDERTAGRGVLVVPDEIADLPPGEWDDEFAPLLEAAVENTGTSPTVVRVAIGDGNFVDMEDATTAVARAQRMASAEGEAGA